MVQIETPSSFDFSEDAHKLLLIRDLEQLAKGQANLAATQQVLAEVPSAAPVFPADMTAGEMAFDAAVGGAVRAPVSFLSMDNGSLGGRLFISGTGVAAAGTNAMSSYTLASESLSRWAPYFNFSHTTSSQQYNMYVVSRLPAGFKGWKPTGVEVDLRVIWTTVATDVCSVSVTVASGSDSGGITENYTAVGATLDTGMVTYGVPASSFNQGSGSDPGAPLSIQVTAQNVRPGTCLYYMGNIRIYWE